MYNITSHANTEGSAEGMDDDDEVLVLSVVVLTVFST